MDEKNRKEELNKFWRDENFKIEIDGSFYTLKECYDQVVTRTKKIFHDTHEVMEQEIPKDTYILYVDATWRNMMKNPEIPLIDEDRLMKVLEAETGSAQMLPETFQADTMRYCLGFTKEDTRFKSWNPYTEDTPEDLSHCVGIVFSGSEANLKEETHPERNAMIEKVRMLIRQSKENNIPKFGICFGGQVLSNEEGSEIDWVTDAQGTRNRISGMQAIFIENNDKEGIDGMPQKFFVAENHEQEIKINHLPHAKILAKDAHGGNEIIRFENTNTTCLQFHPEVSSNRIDIAESIKYPEKNPETIFQNDANIAREILFPLFLKEAGNFARTKLK